MLRVPRASCDHILGAASGLLAAGLAALATLSPACTIALADTLAGALEDAGPDRATAFRV